jgi:hypothetical protein
MSEYDVQSFKMAEWTPKMITQLSPIQARGDVQKAQMKESNLEKSVAVRDLPTTLELSSRAVHLHHTQHVHDELGHHKMCTLGTKMSDRESQKSVFQYYSLKCTMD